MSNKDKSLSDIWSVAKSATFRAVNVLDMTTEMAERTMDYANQSNKLWADEAQAKREQRLAALKAKAKSK